MNFLDNVRYDNLDEDNIGPAGGDILSFLAGCPELGHKPKVLTMLWLCCLYLLHVTLGLPGFRFGSASGAGAGPDLSEVIRPARNYLLSSNPK